MLDPLNEYCANPNHIRKAKRVIPFKFIKGYPFNIPVCAECEERLSRLIEDNNSVDNVSVS